MTRKRCPCCRRKKPATLDHFSGGHPTTCTGLQSWCRACVREMNKSRHHQRRAAGLCHRCSKPNDNEPKWRCRACEQERPATTHAPRVDTGGSMATTKRCTRCRESKPASPEHFNRSSLSGDGLFSWCKDCTRAAKNDRMQQRHASGACIDCGRPAGEFWKCFACRVKQQAREQARRDQQRATRASA